MQGTQVVVFTGSTDERVGWTLREVLNANPEVHLRVYLAVGQRSSRRIWRSIWRNLRHHGLVWLPWRAWQSVLGAMQKLRRGGAQASPWQLDYVASRYGFEVVRVRTLREPEVAESMREFEPVLGLSISAPILKRELFSIPTYGTLNLHKGELPRYRGMPPAFWELWNGEKTCGITVHLVDEGLDTGPIVLKEAVRIPRYASLRGLELLLLLRGALLLARAVRLTLSGQALAQPQPPGGGPAHTPPSLRQEWVLQRRLRRQLPRPTRSLLATVRDAARWVHVRTYVPVRRAARWLTGRVPAAILLYHRINDELRDDITVGIESFEAQVRMLRLLYRPTTLARLLESGSLARNRQRLVVITFDDGYEDNAAVAAPILELYGLTGCFFLPTAMVGTDRAFAHDMRLVGRRIPTMSWEDVRHLAAAGHELGSHTAHHVNVARAKVSHLEAEIRTSVREIEEQTGIRTRFFAFPFGRARHTSPGARDCACRLGFACYCWAAGGVNFYPLRAFELRRCGAHWRTSHDAFIELLEG